MSRMGSLHWWWFKERQWVMFVMITHQSSKFQRVEKSQRAWRLWQWAAIINLQDEKMMSSQDGSQCEQPWKKEGEKGLFFKLAGVRSPIGLFLFLLHTSHSSCPPHSHSLLFRAERGWNWGSYAVIKHQTPHMPHPLTLPLLPWCWRKKPAPAQSQPWERKTGRKEKEGGILSVTSHTGFPKAHQCSHVGWKCKLDSVVSFSAHHPCVRTICLCVHVDGFEHWGPHCEASSHISSFCEVKNTTGEVAVKRGGWWQGLEPQVGGKKQLTSWSDRQNYAPPRRLFFLFCCLTS